MQSTKARRTLLIALPLTLALGFAGGAAYAASERLDEADAHVDQAIALLTAADNPNRAKEPKFGGHRYKAIELLKIVKKEIQKAKEFADKPVPGPRPSSGPPPGPTTPTPAPSTPPKEHPGDGPGKGPKGPGGSGPGKGPKDPSPGGGPKGPKDPGPGGGPKGPSPTPTPAPKTKG